MYPKEVKNKELRKRLDARGHTDVKLWKDDGFFFIETDRMLFQSAIYVNSFNQQSVEKWVDDIESLLDQSEQPNTTEL